VTTTAPAIIQARMSSSRLPGKVLRPLGGAPVLAHVCRAAAAFDAQPVVCTSDLASDDPIVEFCQDNQIVCVRGPLDDVLERFRLALMDARVVESEWFFRVTADCPLLSATLAQALWEAKEDGDAFLGVEQDQLPYGLSAELIARKPFLEMARKELGPSEREHVTMHMYKNPAEYRCRRLSPPAALQHPSLRLTLDYPEDYALLASLFERDPGLTAEGAIAALQEHPALYSAMQAEQARAVRS